MALRKIEVNAPFFSNIEDDARSSVVSAERRDVVKDTLGATVRRPGLSVFTDLPFTKHRQLGEIVPIPGQPVCNQVFPSCSISITPTDTTLR